MGANGISKTIKLHANFGNYENGDVAATAWVDDVDDFESEEEALRYLETLLKKSLASTLTDFDTITTENKSFLKKLDDTYFTD